ncbi:MAG: hypothetical protein SFV81_01785 [Pirellulaceae bacterium]|nr:hypothetical protein [Pirellulaceae bacterium]
MQRFALWVVCLGASFYAAPSLNAVACDHCVAKQKAQQQASEGRMRHVGGSMGSGRYEGVGFSTTSADAAIRQCCYWGQRSPTGIGVARGANGWYATVLYR